MHTGFHRSLWVGLTTIEWVFYMLVKVGSRHTNSPYCLSSLPPVVSFFAPWVRNHKGIVNTYHWSLDVM